jgi:3-deoxy-D-manno-octulosonate 8-phosphate phosphatase (KDO 8-P phosphatase)
MTDIENLYLNIGGRFITPFSEIKTRLQDIKAFVFDWDGVFNNGQKISGTGSGFSEVDSMGTNLLRFAYFLKNGKMPATALLSGEKNETAFYFSEREGFNYCYYKVPHKLEALHHFCQSENLKPSEVAYFYDDVLDIPLAEVCGLRIMINQKVNPLFLSYCERHHLIDYLTSVSGGEFAVREATELLIAMLTHYDEVLEGRKNNTATYQQYIQQRKKTTPLLFTLSELAIKELDPRK